MSFFFFFNDTATTEIYTLSLHDALPIYFDGEPALITEQEMDESGKQIETKVVEEQKAPELEDDRPIIDWSERPEVPARKFYVDKGSVEIAAHLVYELDANGKQLRVV